MDKFRSIAEAVLILGLVIIGGIELQEDKAMYCPSRSIALNCDRTTATRCYFKDEFGDTRYKVCKEGWQPLKDLVEIETKSEVIESIKVSANGGIFSCQTNNGEVNSYTKCIKQDGKEGYLGELV